MCHRYDLSAPPPWELPERKAMEFVGFRQTPAPLTEIHDSVTKGAGEPPQDCRSGHSGGVVCALFVGGRP